MSETITRTIVVDASVEQVYGQWTRFGEFPRFLDYDAVLPLPESRLRWVSTVKGVRHEWVAQVTEMKRNQRIAWVAQGGSHEAGVLTFDRLSPWRTRVTLQLRYVADGFAHPIDELPSTVASRLEDGLESFKGFMEVHGNAGPRRMMGALSPMH
jgi:uncharacterized membrane protein